jgi:hypothetical protein
MRSPSCASDPEADILPHPERTAASKGAAAATPFEISPENGRQYRFPMRSIMPFYPDGVAGAGLLLLRLSVVAALAARAMAAPGLSGWTAYAVAALAAGLVVGLQTRIVAGLCAAWAGFHLFGSEPLATVQLLDAVVLLLLGPGAFSVDARLFGRRTVIVPDHKDRPRKDEG